MSRFRLPQLSTATLLAAGALALAIAASIFLSLANTWHSETCSLIDGVRTCVNNSGSIVEEQGSTVLAYFAVQLALTGAGLLASIPSFEVPMPVRWAIAGFLTVLCLVTGFSLGLLYLPGAAILLLATFIDAREQARQ